MDINGYLKNIGRFILRSAEDYSQKNRTPVRQSMVQKPMIEDETMEKPKPKIESKREKPPLIRTDKEFVKLFKQLTYRHNAWEAWSDFVTMFACSISNPLDKTHYDEREKLYLKTIDKYNKTEQSIFPQLAAMTVMALERNPEQDFLGKIYMDLGLGNKSTSQFFTPYHVCKLMAAVTMDNVVDEVKEKGYISINDPTCGAGATLIAGVNEARKKLEKANINFQNHVLVVAQDIDFTVAMMCYIQLSLLGVAGYIKVGNSLTEPLSTDDTTENYWFTPMYFSDVWITRRIFRKVDSITRKEKKNGNTIT